jgi:hypothetical protein
MSWAALGWLIWASSRAAAPSPGPMNVNIKDLYVKNIGKNSNYSPQVWYMSRLPLRLIIGSTYFLQLL